MASNQTEASTKKLSFLFIEDDQDLLNMYQIYFSGVFNAYTDGALDSETAIRKIREKHYDLITIDFTMTPIYGNELIKTLREKQLVDESITSLIAISTGGEWKEVAFRELGVPHIIKPFLLEEANNVIRRELKRIGRIQE